MCCPATIAKKIGDGHGDRAESRDGGRARERWRQSEGHVQKRQEHEELCPSPAEFGQRQLGPRPRRPAHQEREHTRTPKTTHAGRR